MINKQEVTIASMTKDQLERVIKIYSEGIDTGIATFQTECPSITDWDEGHIEDCRFIAEIDGDIKGWAALSPVSKRKVYEGVVEVSVYIAEEARGLGIGSKLLEKLVEVSEEKGYWTLYSSIFEENYASIALHEKCGFRKIGYREKIARDSQGIWRNTVIMERRSKIL